MQVLKLGSSDALKTSKALSLLSEYLSLFPFSSLTESAFPISNV